MFKARIGDIFASEAHTLVNTVNCVGVMGKGVALEFKKRWPAMFKDYQRQCTLRQVRIGEPYLYSDLLGASIINFPTKDHWRSPSRVVDIERGLDFLVAHAETWGIISIALPPLGCGNGGLDWSEVGPLIYQKLHRAPFDVEVYAPFGTSAHQLSEDFLVSPAQKSESGKGRRMEKLNPEWVTLVEVLREVQAQPYANPIGRTIFQKVCYVLTEMGVSTGFQFGKGSYGPFSPDVKLALHEMANRNWLQEKPLGKMVALTVGPQYEVDRPKFAAQIQANQKRIAKAVDLFSRIKNTEQAEEIMTVLYASRQVKQARRADAVTEQDIYEYVLNWKTTWRTEAKRQAVASAIRNLLLLGWMKVQASEELLEAV
ncbi:macro domain-containing protein [Cyanobium sp. LEGE 06143]|nr:macro domain-containing protein [Cyanobium sp. LEGE 06143]